MASFIAVVILVFRPVIYLSGCDTGNNMLENEAYLNTVDVKFTHFASTPGGFFIDIFPNTKISHQNAFRLLDISVNNRKLVKCGHQAKRTMFSGFTWSIDPLPKKKRSNE